ncbi:MAG: hypothetical protein JSU81_11155 [Candidatus Coatesbacteria bacterium]|nr:MAG: hypothetical protein JSU81_11155 [Candidatus Coatesbacteria bacterium]
MKTVVMSLLLIAVSLAGADTRLGWSDYTAEEDVVGVYWFAARYDLSSYGHLVDSYVYFTIAGHYSLTVFGYEWPHKVYFQERNIIAYVGWNTYTLDTRYTEQRYALIAVEPHMLRDGLGVDNEAPNHGGEMFRSPATGTIRFAPWGPNKDLMIHVLVRNVSGVRANSLGRIKALY